VNKFFSTPGDEFETMPKVELHRHLEGSLRISTMMEIAQKHGVTIPAEVIRLSRLVQVQDGEPYTFENFLAKFNTLRLFYRSPEAIDRITREAIEDAAKDNIQYMELRFTPVALSRAERFPLHDVMDWVCTSARDAAKKHKMIVRLIASVNRHESPELAEQVAWLAADNMSKGIVGLDLAGNEAQFSAQPFSNIFREARQSGLFLTVHAGEWGEATNVRQAIEDFGAVRIGHGVRVLEDAYSTELARERRTTFEVCLTSNYQSGVVPSLKSHPFKRMMDAGLNVTLNTDDPSISKITLSNEYRLAVQDLGVPIESLKQSVLSAGLASFLPDNERVKLIEQLRKQLK
jgi:adenosine deaminase